MLLETPRPKRLLKFRLAGAPSFKLYVRALSSHQLADAPGDFIPYLLQQAVVLQNGSLAFSSPEKLSEILSVVEFKNFSTEVLNALSEISPMFNYCEAKEWNEKLEEGARHGSNFALTNSLGMCFNLMVLPDRIITQDHPEWFFNIPRNDLLDCHWMAYWSARKVYRESVLDGSEKDKIDSLKREQEGKIKWKHPTTNNQA